VGLPQAPVEARFSPNRQENPVAGESGPTPPEFRGRVLRHRRAGPPVRDIAIFYLGWSFRPSLTGGQRSSPSRPNQEQLSHFARAVVFEPQSPYSPPVLIHLVAPLRTHFLDVEVTACRQGDQCGRRRSIRTPRGRRLAAADAVAEMPAERWRSQEGPTPKLEVVRGTHVAPLGTPAFKVGRRVRISFAPAVSPCKPAHRAISLRDERGGVGIRLEPAAAIVRQYGEQFHRVPRRKRTGRRRSRCWKCSLSSQTTGTIGP
jgi:hypothetical protein